MYCNIYNFDILQCEKCWPGSGNLQGHFGRHCLLSPQERRNKRNKRQNQLRKRKRFKKPVCCNNE